MFSVAGLVATLENVPGTRLQEANGKVRVPPSGQSREHTGLLRSWHTPSPQWKDHRPRTFLLLIFEQHLLSAGGRSILGSC